MTQATDHDRFKELVPLVALGAASPGEVAALVAHANSCQLCRSEIDSLAVTASRIGASVPQVSPPPRLKTDLMAAIRAEPKATSAATRTRSRVRRRAWPALSGALAATIVGLMIWNITLRNDAPNPVALPPAQVAQNVTVDAQLTTVNGRRVAVVHVAGLPPVTPDQGYEVWLVPVAGAPQSSGFMTAIAGGGYSTVVDVSDDQVIAVTREPRTNTTAPTSTQLVVIPT